MAPLRLLVGVLRSFRYIQPGALCPMDLNDAFGLDWSWNARGIYYRHQLSRRWHPETHQLWIPATSSEIYNSTKEQSRRKRAQRVVDHAQNNKNWEKSEFAWESDAWTDVFARLRKDSIVAW